MCFLVSWFSSLYTFALETILLVQIKPSCNAHPPFAMVEPSYFGNQHVSRPEGDPQFLTAVSSASANSWQQQADRVSRDLLDRQPNQPTFNHPTLLDTPKMYQNVNMSLGPGENPFFSGGGTLFLMAAVPHLQALHHPVHPTHHLRPWRSPSKPRHFGILPNSLGLYIDTHHMCA